MGAGARVLCTASPISRVVLFCEKYSYENSVIVLRRIEKIKTAPLCNISVISHSYVSKIKEPSIENADVIEKNGMNGKKRKEKSS